MSETPIQPEAQPAPQPNEGPAPVTAPVPEEPPAQQSVDLNPDEVDLNGETLYEGDVEDSSSDEEGDPPQPHPDGVAYKEDEDELEEPDFDADGEDQA